MRSSKRILVAIGIAVVVLLTAACGASVSPTASTKATATAKPVATVAGSAKRGGTLTMSLGDDFVTFDPFYDVTNAEFKQAIFEAPVRISPDGTKYEPWLAESVEESADGKSVTLRLRKGIKFHNGREVTADDVVWSVTYAMDETAGHHNSDRFKTAAGATKIDQYTVRIDYKEVDPSKYVALSHLFLYPKEALKDIATKPIGTGPFKFDEWVPGDHLTLSSFADYWRKGVPYLDKIIVKPMPDTQARLINLKAGSIDLLMGVPLSDKAALAKTTGILVSMQPAGASFYAFLFNITKPPFDNTLVRQALQYTIDRDKINKAAFSSEGTPAYLPYASTSWAYDAELAKRYTYDLNKAKELLAKAGYPNGFKTQILIRGASGPHLDQAQVWQQDLAKVGIQAELLPTELPQYWPRLYASDFAIVSHGTGDSDLDPSGLFISAACCRPFRNFFQITTNTDWFPKYEQLIYQGRDELERTKRKAIYRNVLDILQEQSWVIPTIWSQQTYASKDSIKGFRTDQDGYLWLDEAYLSK